MDFFSISGNNNKQLVLSHDHEQSRLGPLQSQTDLRRIYLNWVYIINICQTEAE